MFRRLVTFMTAAMVLASLLVSPAQPAAAQVAGWWNTGWDFRVPVTIGAGAVARTDKIANVPVNFTSLIAAAGSSGAFDPNSVRVVEVDAGGGTVINENVPFQFDRGDGYNATSSATGTVVVQLTGSTGANANRFYHIYFDTVGAAPFAPPAFPNTVNVADNVDYRGQLAYVIDTPTAKYYYHKDGAGFVSILDRDSLDWVDYKPYDPNDPSKQPNQWGSGSSGEFRGVPNAGAIFHPGYANRYPNATSGNTNGSKQVSRSEIIGRGPLKLTIRSTSYNGQWQVIYEIYATHTTATMVKKPAEQPYYWLYEGTPGGTVNDGDFIRLWDGNQYIPSNNQSFPIPFELPAAPGGGEWVYFGDAALNRVFYFVQHTDDAINDSFRVLTTRNVETSPPSGRVDSMFEFGFGRSNADGLQERRLLTATPLKFTMGFAEDKNHDAATQVINEVYQDFAMTLGGVQVNNSAPPTAANDSYTGAVNRAVVMPVSSSVLTNDSDPDRNQLTARSVSNPANGTLTMFNPEGSFIYTPNSGFTGTDSFTYQASDGFGNSNTATVTINIVATATVAEAEGNGGAPTETSTTGTEGVNAEAVTPEAAPATAEPTAQSTEEQPTTNVLPPDTTPAGPVGHIISATDPRGFQPGEVFREYIFNEGNRVTTCDKTAGTTDTRCSKRDQQRTLRQNVDLTNATRAEVALEYWSGHIGTANVRFQVNNTTWKLFPRPVGTDNPAECYYHNVLGSAIVPVALNTELKPGNANVFRFSSGKQICNSFAWGLHSVYNFTTRVYYNPSAVTHPTGQIEVPADGRLVETGSPGAVVGPTINIAVQPNGTQIQQVDLIGYYSDYDWEGDGTYASWHYQLDEGEFTQGANKRHIGTATRAGADGKYTIQWNTEWLPDQYEPVQLMARIRTTNGVSYVTPIATANFIRNSGRLVAMYPSVLVPEKFGVSTGERKFADILVEREGATSGRSQVAIALWSGLPEEDDNPAAISRIQINNTDLITTTGIGRSDDYSYHQLDILRGLREGINTIAIFSDRQKHPLEVHWPGPAILTEYTGTLGRSQNLTTTKDTPINVTLAGVTSTGNPVSLAVRRFPNSGTLTGTEPNMTYTPNPGFVGEDSFTYEAEAGGARDIATVTIRVEPGNGRPVINTAPPTIIRQGENWTARGTFEDDGGTATGTVDYGDGTGPQPLTIQSRGGFALNHTYNDNGTYQVTVTVTDEQGSSASATRQVVVANTPATVTPSADITSNGTEFVLGTFTGSANATYTVNIDWGDGQTSPGTVDVPTRTISGRHAYRTAGSYTVRFTLADDEGNQSSGSLRITVTSAPPFFTAGADVTVRAGATTNFTLGTFANGDATDRHTVSINWGDGQTTAGTVNEAGKTVSGSHTYATPGRYTITVTLADDDGATSTDTLIATVVDPNTSVTRNIYVPVIGK